MMAVWNVIQKRHLWPRIDLAAEHYHPDKISCLELLGHSSGRPLSSIARPVREIVTSPPAGGPVFDTNAASTHILTEESAQQEKRISAKKIGRSGDVIISRLRSYLKQVAWIPEAIHSAYLTTEFVVLRSRNNSPIAHLLPFLLSNPVQTVLHWSQDGSEHPRFKEEVLLSLNIPHAVLSHVTDLNALIYDAASNLQHSFDLYSQAESLLLTELGLDKIDLSPSLFFEARYSETIKAGRLDAEYFASDPLIQWRAPYPTKPLGELAVKIENGLTPASSEYSEDGPPILKVGGLLNKGEISWLGDRVSINSRINNTSKGQAKSNDVFVLCAAHHVRYIGKSGMLWEVPEGQVCRYVGELIGIRCSSQLRPEILTVYLNLAPVFHSVQRLIRGLSAHLYPQDLATLPVPLLPDKVQDEISDMLGKSHAARQESKRLIDKAVRLVEKSILETGR